MSPLNMKLVRKFTVSNVQRKVNKSIEGISLLCGLCTGYRLQSDFPEMPLDGTIQGGSLIIISHTSFMCSFGLCGYLIKPLCIDPVREFFFDIFGYVTSYQTLGTVYCVCGFLFLHCRGLNGKR